MDPNETMAYKTNKEVYASADKVDFACSFATVGCSVKCVMNLYSFGVGVSAGAFSLATVYPLIFAAGYGIVSFVMNKFLFASYLQ